MTAAITAMRTVAAFVMAYCATCVAVTAFLARDVDLAVALVALLMITIHSLPAFALLRLTIGALRALLAPAGRRGLALDAGLFALAGAINAVAATSLAGVGVLFWPGVLAVGACAGLLHRGLEGVILRLLPLPPRGVPA